MSFITVFHRIVARSLVATAVMVCACPAGGADGDAFFREYVESILARRCYECHSHSAGEASGGLVLDSRAGWTVGGDSGPAIVPGAPEKSLVWKALQHSDPNLKMPPDGKLPAEEMALLEKWIRDGAADPRIDGRVEKRKGIDLEKGRQWWAFRPVVRRPIEGRLAVHVDRSIAEQLSSVGLKMSPEASPAVLVRRLCFDLTGLPPDRNDVRAVEECDPAERPARVEQYVDRLLASRQFAEKWGRHWLDVARYADSNGSSFNPPFHQAWRYRNWVIDAIDRDMPVNDFIVRQLAGDLLPAESQSERDENIVATGYLMLGSKVLGEFDKEQLTLDVIDEQLDTIGKSLLGMTVACARCHDHKFDPIPQTDYYALAGILWSTVTLEDRIGGPKEDESDSSRRGLGAGGDEQLAAFLREHRYPWTKATNKRFQAAKKLSELQKQTSPDAAAVEAATKELREAEAALSAIEARLPAWAMSPRDADEPTDIPLRVRGVPASHGPVVPRGFLQVASFGGQPVIQPRSSGRLELARWIASDQNPLTARVFVNRVWKHLFREGLVRSADNFGTTGELPSHPELLDDLAACFMEGGWRLKPFVRELVLSSAYQQAAGVASATDPENRLLSSQNRRRLEPEEIRDSLLAVAGELDLSPGGPMIGHLPLGDISTLGEWLAISDRRRTVYQPVFRTLEPDVLQIFDAPNNAMATAVRPKTIVAPQALYFLNSSFVHRAAERIADRVGSTMETTSPTDARLAEAVSCCFKAIVCRAPTPSEQQVLVGYLHAQSDGPPGLSRHDLLKLCQTILGSTQFQFIE